MIIEVRLHPNSSQTLLKEIRSGVLEVWVKEKALKGVANEALITLVAHHFGVAKSTIEIKAGHSSRRKRLYIPKKS